MKVNSNSNRDISFNGIWNSKALKKTLQFAEKNGALFTASTTLIFSAGFRPLAIWAAPKTDKENKKVACAKSISSSISEFFLTYAISKPIVNAIGLIDKNPAKYIKPQTIKALKESAGALTESKAYTLATQLFKLGLGLAVAAPKAILTTLGMPYVLEVLFHQPPPKHEADDVDMEDFVEHIKERHGISDSDDKDPAFKGGVSNSIAKGLGKILDLQGLQKFSTKYKDSNFPMHIIAIKDALTTGMFIQQTAKSEKIREERKLPVMYNAFISTGLSITSSYIVDRLLEKPAQKVLNKIKQANKNDPNLHRYVKGFKIAKPVIIVACIYYAIIPFISTFIAERAEKKHAFSFIDSQKKVKHK